MVQFISQTAPSFITFFDYISSSYLCTILKIENQPSVLIDYDCVNNRQPEPIIKFSERFVLLRKVEHKGPNTVRFCFPFRFAFFNTSKRSVVRLQRSTRDSYLAVHSS